MTMHGGHGTTDDRGASTPPRVPSDDLTPTDGTEQAAGSLLDHALRQLGDAIAVVATITLEQLDDAAIHQLATQLRRPLARLGAVTTRLAGEVEVRAARAAAPTQRRAAVRDARAFVGDQLGLDPARAKRAGETGRRLAIAPTTAAALDAGDLQTDHAAIITDVLCHVPAHRHDAVEHELVALARTARPPEVRRAARRLLAREDVAAAEAIERRQHHRRRVSWWDTDDGGLGFAGQLYGEMAEHARTAFEAFTTPDASDEQRTPDQRRADGFDALVAAALRVGDAPTQHGVRPHVTVLVAWSDLATGTGVGELGRTGPVTMTSLRPLLRDCTVSRIVLGPDSVPIEVGGTTRTVPAGLWRALVARDRGCRWAGCTAPPSWCDVAHGAVPFVDGGALSLTNAALLCRRHHRLFDLGPWRISITGADVTFTRTDQTSNRADQMTDATGDARLDRPPPSDGRHPRDAERDRPPPSNGHHTPEARLDRSPPSGGRPLPKVEREDRPPDGRARRGPGATNRRPDEPAARRALPTRSSRA